MWNIKNETGTVTERINWWLPELKDKIAEGEIREIKATYDLVPIYSL